MKAKEFFGREIGFFIGPGSSYYCGNFKVYDWTVAADQKTPREPLFDMAILDNFKNNRYQWEQLNDQDVSASITNDAFRIRNKFNGTYMPTLLFGEKDVTSCRVELSAKHVEGVNDYGYGLCLGKKDVNNAIIFFISFNGYFSIYRIENGNWNKIKDWTESDAIYKSSIATNTLKFVNDSYTWDFYINNKLVYSRSAGSLPGRQYGCIVENKQTIEFTRFSFARMSFPTAQGF